MNGDYIPGSLSISYQSENSNDSTLQQSKAAQQDYTQSNSSNHSRGGKGLKSLTKKMQKSKEERLIDNLNLRVPFPPPTSYTVPSSVDKMVVPTESILDHPILEDAKVAFDYFQEYH